MDKKELKKNKEQLQAEQDKRVDKLTNILKMKDSFMKVKIVQPFHGIGDGICEGIITNSSDTQHPFGYLYRVMDCVMSPFIVCSPEEHLVIWGNDLMKYRANDILYAKIGIVDWDKLDFMNLRFQFSNTGIEMILPYRLWDTIEDFS